MTKLCTGLVAAFLAMTTAVPILGQIADSVPAAAPMSPEAAVRTLGYGSTQVVLAFCLVIVTMGGMWAIKRLLKSKDEQIQTLGENVQASAVAMAAVAENIKTFSEVVRRCEK